jgi:hypothetical protein
MDAEAHGKLIDDRPKSAEVVALLKKINKLIAERKADKAETEQLKAYITPEELKRLSKQATDLARNRTVREPGKVDDYIY